MSPTYNVYCDESCHLEHDQQKAMVLGAIWCLEEKTAYINVRIREIKERHGLAKNFEIKWTKVSPAKLTFYMDLLDYFFDNEDLHFRALIIPDKTKLQHEAFNQDHDTWYYKMYFDMLKAILTNTDRYRIYLDIKDSKSSQKTAHLKDVLCNSLYDFDNQIIERLQIVRSHEIEISQLADLLIGLISYVNRGLNTNSAKIALVERMQGRSGYSLVKTNLLREPKVNIFIWQPTEAQG